jgi:membrane complex biogenesis BtpA family protein
LRPAVLPDHPLVACLHLPPGPGCIGFAGRAASLEALRADLAALDAAGVDAILLENENDKPHTLVVSRAQAAWLAMLAVEARRATRRPLAVGVQRIDWETTLAVAVAADLQGVRLDTFVDRVVMQGIPVEVDPAAVRALRAALGVPGLELWTDVHVKHAELVGGEALAGSAARAVDEGAAAVLVTGTRTGEPPTAADLEEARAAVRGRAPVWLASGLDAGNARALRRLCDGAIVGTALKNGARVDLARARRVVETWRA